MTVYRKWAEGGMSGFEIIANESLRIFSRYGQGSTRLFAHLSQEVSSILEAVEICKSAEIVQIK